MKKGIMKKNVAVFAFAMIAACADAELKVERIFREPHYVRGNINILTAPGTIDEAHWIWHPDYKNEIEVSEPRFLRFRNRFTVKEGSERVEFDISADERFYLLCDGEFVARGPNRSMPENWQYQSYAITLVPGEHVFEAVVWKTQNEAPLAQLSWRGGFVFKGFGEYDGVLTTGKADWEVGIIDGIKPAGRTGGPWGTGSQFEITGAGPYSSIPAKWTKAVSVRGSAGINTQYVYGSRTLGWMLFPTQLPDQLARRVTPGDFRAVTHNANWREKYAYTEAETKAPEVAQLNNLLKKGKSFVVPANTKLQAAWDLGVYYCGYPEIEVSGGKGARIAWGWAESARYKTNDRKEDRNTIIGKYIDAFADNFICDGRKGAIFSAPWFRCGRWCRLDIETGNQPVEIKSLSIIETRYPVEMESEFRSSHDSSMADIRRICARAMQMCCHEMLFDCPYYEQQMYPGDTRVQLQVLSALSRDDRIIRRAIELYDLAQRDDGMVPFNWPTRGTQEGATYTIAYVLMYGDYVMNHANREWLRARIPGLRKTMSGLEYYENKDGLLEDIPGWSFVDWVPDWLLGTPECSQTRPGEKGGVSCVINAHWAMALKAAATVERALGNELMAQYWDKKRERLGEAIVARFWDQERGLLADSDKREHYSEHAQCLAILADILPRDKRMRAFQHLVEDEDLKRCTVYFSYYLFETYFKFGRGDLFRRRLDLWRSYLKKGLTTTQESPDSEKQEVRSDCHAWGAHPIWFMQTGLAGIRSDAPFFARVCVQPSPGGLRDIEATHPHPDGWIKVNLKFERGKVSGTVTTPVPGRFVWRGKEVPLVVGENTIVE